MAEQNDLPLDEPGDEPAKVEISAEELEALREGQKTLETQLQAERLEKARLEERLNQPPPAEPAPKPRATEAQLQAAVDEGTISQAQMNSELARQMREDITNEVKTSLTQEFEAKEQLKTVKAQFDGYVENRPDVKVEGTEDRRRVQEEIQALMELGHAYDMRTEVAAMRTVFGSLDRVKETTRKRREVHQEAGGAGGGDAGGSGTAKWQKGLTPSQIAGFKHELSTNLYKSEDDKMFLDVTTRRRTKNAAGKAAA